MLYRISPIGEKTPLIRQLLHIVSRGYGWRQDCTWYGNRTFSREAKMLKITRAANGEVVFTLSGRIAAENIPELKTLFESEAQGRPVILDLENVTLVDRDAVKFLASCEADSIRLKNCPAYIREWIARERKAE
jgi:hypothetical protein